MNAIELKDIYTVIQDILASDDKLQDVAKQSYYHKNDFYKVLIKEELDGSVWRIHCFIKASGNDAVNCTVKDQNPHDHAWNFTSTVLQGSLDDTRYIEGYESYNSRLFVKCKMAYLSNALVMNKLGLLEKPDWSLVPVGETYLTPIRRQTFRAGQIYSMDRTAIHTTFAESTGTMTLVKQSSVPKDATNYVYVPKDKLLQNQECMGAKQRALTVHEVRFVLTAALSVLCKRCNIKSKL